MPPTLAEQVITLMVATNDLTSWSWLPPGKTKTDVIIVLCIFIGMVTFFAFMARGQIREYRRAGKPKLEKNWRDDRVVVSTKPTKPKHPPSILFIIWMSILPCILGILLPAMYYFGMITPGDPDEAFIAIVIWAVMTAISVLVFGFIILNDPSGKSYLEGYHKGTRTGYRGPW